MNNTGVVAKPGWGVVRDEFDCVCPRGRRAQKHHPILFKNIQMFRNLAGRPQGHSQQTYPNHGYNMYIFYY